MNFESFWLLFCYLFIVKYADRPKGLLKKCALQDQNLKNNIEEENLSNSNYEH